MVARYFTSIFIERNPIPMKVTVENTGPCQKQVNVEFSAEEIQKEYDESLAMFAKHGSVKGFRPGKAPVEMIRRMYDKKILEGLYDHLLARGFQQAMKEHKLETVAEYDLKKSELKAGQPFSFSLTVDVEPEFELPAYKGIEVETKKVDITEDAVGQAVDHYRENTGKYEDLKEDRPVQAGDMVAVDYTATVDGKPMAEVSEKAKGLAAGTDFWVIANEEYSFLPGFGPALVGLKVGASKDISVAFDAQAPIEELRGKTGLFQATVKKIRAKTKAALDEEFFKSVGVKDEAELRETFKRMLQGEAERHEHARRRNQLIDALMKNATLDVPESEAHDESHRIVYEMVEENTRRGVPEQEIRDNIGKISESAKTAAKDRLKLRYLLKRIAREEKIEVADAEVSALMAQQALRSGAKSVKEWLQQMKLKEGEVRKGLRADLLTTKTIDALMGHAKLTGEGAEAAKK
ncbi:MAG TPA: trigger factor [Verrucomicrobia bacterium]|nr:trigger factor [Verrucomicrobiota bacterium]